MYSPKTFSLNLELRTHEHETALWLALMQLDSHYLSSEDITDYEHTFATRLIKRGANPDSIESRSGNSLLHKAALQSNESAAVFLVHHGAVPNGKNTEGEAPIHIAARNGLDQLVKVLLQHGADPNLQTAIKPKQALSPLILPPAGEAAGSRSNASTAASSMTKLDDIAADAPQVGGGLVSPTALGALSALSSVTSHVRMLLYKLCQWVFKRLRLSIHLQPKYICLFMCIYFLTKSMLIYDGKYMYLL